MVTHDDTMYPWYTENDPLPKIYNLNLIMRKNEKIPNEKYFIKQLTSTSQNSHDHKKQKQKQTRKI